MRGFTAILLLCAISSAAQTDDTAQRALDLVTSAGENLSNAEGNEAFAREQKRKKSKNLINAQNYLNRLPGWRVLSRGRAKQTVKFRERALKSATTIAVAAQERANEQGQNYLQAEEEYLAETGSYSDPERVEYWQSRITFVPDEPDPAAPVTPETVEQQAQEISEIVSGGLNPTTMGQLTGRAGSIENMTDKLVAQIMNRQGAFSQTPGASPAGAGTPPARPGFSNRPGDYSSQARGYRNRAALGSISDKTLRDTKILLSDGRAGAGRRRRRDPFAESSRRRLAAGDAEGALQAAEKSIRRNPGSAIGYVLKAQALNKLRRFDEAEEAAKRALDRDPENEKAYKSLIWAQLHNGKAEEASANASRLLRIQPDNAEAYLMRGFAKELLGDRMGMLRDLERAARLDPRYRGHLAKARAGELLFDPKASDSEKLLDAIQFEEPPEPKRALPFVAIGLTLLIFSIGTPLVNMLIQRRRQSAVGAGTRTSTLEFERRTENDAPVHEDLLAGKFRLDQMVGRGGMGKVWKATDTTLDRPVAIKQMVEMESGPEQTELLKMYRKEARTLANLHHPGIVDIYEVLDLHDGIYLVFEWIEGKTVHQMLAEEHKLPLHRVLQILEPVLEALTLAHSEGVVHRDMKPANIMVSEAGHVKLMDFGIARAAGQDKVVEMANGNIQMVSDTRTNTIAGTPAYRGPEAARGIVTPAFDIYGVGATFYEMLTGKLPFGPSGQESVHATSFVKASTLAPGLPINVDAVVAFCLQADHTKRFKDAPALLAEFRKLQGRPGPA